MGNMLVSAKQKSHVGFARQCNIGLSKIKFKYTFSKVAKIRNSLMTEQRTYGIYPKLNIIGQKTRKGLNTCKNLSQTILMSASITLYRLSYILFNY